MKVNLIYFLHSLKDLSVKRANKKTEMKEDVHRVMDLAYHLFYSRSRGWPKYKKFILPIAFLKHLYDAFDEMKEPVNRLP